MTPSQPWETTIPQRSLVPADKRYWSFFPNTIDESVPRATSTANITSVTDGVLYCVGNLVIPAGALVSNINLFLSNQAPTNFLNNWLALIDEATGVVLGKTADLAAPYGVSALASTPLTTPYRATVDQPVYVGILQRTAAGVLNSFRGITGLSGGVNSQPNLAGFSNAGLTDPASLPSPVTDPTGATTGIPWVGLT